MVTGALAASLRAAGVEVRALKPIASGVEGEVGEDATFLGLAAGHAAESAASFRAALSPQRAAALEGRVIDVPAVLAWVRARSAGVTLVEGVGGWEVPLAPDWRVSALAAALGYPVLIVAADQLGVLSAVLLTVAAVQNAGLPVAGVVLVGLGDDASSEWNLQDLRALLPSVSVRRFPYLSDFDFGRLAAAGQALLYEDVP